MKVIPEPHPSWRHSWVPTHLLQDRADLLAGVEDGELGTNVQAILVWCGRLGEHFVYGELFDVARSTTIVRPSVPSEVPRSRGHGIRHESVRICTVFSAGGIELEAL